MYFSMATGVTAESVLDCIIQGHLECSICHTRYQEPKMLHCSHSFCLKCLQELKQSQHPNNDKVTCPLCQRETTLPEGGVDKLNTNYTLISLVEEVTNQEQLLKCERCIVVICQSCDEENEAISQCMDCEQYLCEKCHMAHLRLAALNLHTVTSVTELKESASSTVPKKDASRCEIHPSKELCFYCNTCEMLICKVCATSNHKEPIHMYIDLKTTVDTCLKDARDKIGEAYRVDAYVNISGSWRSLRDRLGVMLGETNDLISQTAERKIRQIRHKEKQLKQIAKATYRKKDKTLAEMEVAEQTVKMVDREITDANRREILKFREDLLHDFKDVTEDSANQVTNDLSFIGFKEDYDDVRLGKVLDKEKWELFKTSKILGDFISAFSTGDMVITNTSNAKIVKLSPQLTVLKVDNNTEELSSISVNEFDQLITLSGPRVTVLNKDFQSPSQFSPGKEADTDGTPSCLAVDDNNLIAVGYKDKEQISLHNPDGSIIRTLPAPMIDSYMTISNQQIIYTNSNKKQLMSVDYESNIKFTVQIRKKEDPNCPCGVCCDKGGYIYTIVSGPERQDAASKAVHQAPSRAVRKSQGFSFLSSVAAPSSAQTPTYKAAVECYSPNGKLLRSISGDEMENNSRGITYTPDGKLVLTGVKSTLIYHRV